MKIRILVLSLLFFINYTNAGLEVKLNYGTIRGRIAKTAKNFTYYAFQEVPYAAPPIGNLRFAAPQPPKKFEGVLNTVKNTKQCYAVPTDGVHETEDCLYLNVYTPVDPGSKANLSVIVYFHGGGFVLGSGRFNGIGPHFFMEKNIIMVIPNYRLGPFGFLSTATETIKGNNGLKDQTMVLKWVQENIHLFGGDKSKVTIRGHSAGGSSVTFHLLSKKSAGLFRAAAAQSGAAITPWSFQRNAREIAFATAKLIDPNFTSKNEKELRDFLLKAKAKDIDNASRIFSSQNGKDMNNEEIVQGFYYAPIVEPNYEDAFVSESFYEIMLNGRFNQVPLMIGITSEEYIHFAGSNHDNFKKKLEIYEAHPEYLVPHGMNVKNEDLRKKCGKEIRKIYLNDTEKMPDNLGRSLKLFSDTSFNRGITRFAEIASNFTDVYFYQFSYEGPMGGDSIVYDGADTVSHGEDNNYINVVNDKSSLEGRTKNDILTHDRLMKLYVDFTNELNPTPRKSELLNNIVFEKVKPNHFSYVDINGTVAVHVNQYPKELYYRSWLRIYEEYGVPPFVTF